HTCCVCEKEKFGGLTRVAFTPDGRLLAASRGPVRFYDVATGKEVQRFEMHGKRIWDMAVSPDGQTLATGSDDQTAVIWDLAKVKPPELKPQELGPKQLESLWADLAGPDAAKAHRAIWTLIASPAQSLPFFKERLPTSFEPTAEQQR